MLHAYVRYVYIYIYIYMHIHICLYVGVVQTLVSSRDSVPLPGSTNRQPTLSLDINLEGFGEEGT